jgi:hypothetical protein
MALSDEERKKMNENWKVWFKRNSESIIRLRKETTIIIENIGWEHSLIWYGNDSTWSPSHQEERRYEEI